MATITLVLDAGHGGSDSGATSKHPDLGLIMEKTYAWELCQALAEKKTSEMKIFVVPHDSSTSMPNPNRLSNRVKWACEKKPTHFISIHWNASDSNRATGTETWYNASQADDRHYAVKLSRAVASAIGIQDRGCNPDTSNRHRRLGILHGHDPKVKACLLEVAFITNPKDVDKYRENVDDVVAAILETLK